MASHPPPLPNAEPAWATYLKAFGTIFPALGIWGFSIAFMMPKLEWLWQHTNLGGSKIQWVMDACVFLTRHMRIVVLAIYWAILILELGVKSWPRHRRAVVAVVTILVHTTVLLAVTAVAVAALIAVPLLTRGQTPAVP